MASISPAILPFTSLLWSLFFSSLRCHPFVLLYFFVCKVPSLPCPDLNGNDPSPTGLHAGRRKGETRAPTTTTPTTRLNTPRPRECGARRCPMLTSCASGEWWNVLDTYDEAAPRISPSHYRIAGRLYATIPADDDELMTDSLRLAQNSKSQNIKILFHGTLSHTVYYSSRL